MSRAFDVHIENLVYYLMNSNMLLSTSQISLKNLKEKINFYRSDFLSRRPQVLITDKNGNNIKVIKSKYLYNDQYMS